MAPLPRRQLEIAERVGSIVEGELFSYADLREQVVTPEFLERVNRAIKQQVGEILEERRLSLPGFVQRFVTDDMVRGARRRITREIGRHLPALVDDMFELLGTNLSIRHLVASKVAALELEKLEDVVFTLAARELRLIEIFCGVLGMLIGTGQLLLTL